MEFYELNRLYDETLKYTKPSDRVDSYLYFLIPTVISFGLGISLISIVSFARHRNHDHDGSSSRTSPRIYLTSKNYLFAQSIANCAFQVVTSTILITNYYEKRLIDSYFQNNKNTYFSLKCFLNITYNVLLYNVIWLFVVGAIDYCMVAIKKMNMISNYSKRYRQMFERLLAAHQLQNLRQNHSVIKKIRPNQLRTASTRHHPYQNPHQQHPPSQQHHLEMSSRTRCSSSTSCNEYHHLHPLPHHHQTEAADFISMDELNQYAVDEQPSSQQQQQQPPPTVITTSCQIETDRIFCKPKTVAYSIFSVVFFSLMLVFPQLFAYEIKQNEISLSPSPMPTSNKALESLANYENFYFVESDDYSSLNNKSSSVSAQQEHLKEEYLFRLLNKTSLSYSDTVGRAMAFSVRIDRRDKHVRELLAYMHKTHKRFFTQTGFFNLVTKEYNFCNIIKNSLDAAPIIVRPAPPRLAHRRRRRSVLRFDETAERVEYFNLTLTCIKKSDLNTALTYNTLYFWLEHCLVIAVPFCVNLVVISSLIYIFLTFTKFQTNQYRFLLKRRKLTKMCKKGLNSNRQTLYINENQLSRKESKKYRAHKPGSDINILSEQFINELNQLEAYESNLIKKQHDDKNLTLMFILDLFLYFLISFPYTLMRLILDLFVKDQVKISLDFFILFKTSMLAFHFHLIAKFFLMLSLNRNFRKCLVWAFSIQNSKCHHPDETKNRQHQSDVRCCCLFRRGSKAANRRRQNSWWLSGSSPTDSYLDMDANNNTNMQKDYTSYSLEEENFYHSTEFNSDYHQFYCPAEPNDTDLLPNNLPSTQSKNKLSYE